MSGDPHDSGPRAPAMKLMVPGTYEAIRLARSSLLDWLERCGAAERAAAEVGLVLTEICNNAVEHGSAAPTLPLRVAAEVRGGDLHVEILEGAAEVDKIVEGLAAAAAPPKAAEERGRGFFLIRAYVDDIEVGTQADGSLRIRLRKRIAP